MVEGFNNKAKVTLKKAYGFRTFNAMHIIRTANSKALSLTLITRRIIDRNKAIIITITSRAFSSSVCLITITVHISCAIYYTCYSYII
ncbi:MAG: transposase [Deltaproteobacteria bacterium]|nr:transposase [Deltaproteobacteria bacterium]